jgi:outer membrane protein
VLDRAAGTRCGGVGSTPIKTLAMPPRQSRRNLYLADMKSLNPIVALLVVASIAAPPASAQETGTEAKAPRRTRVGLGPQLVPSYPGSGSVSVRPLVDVSRTRGDTPFAFEAPDESVGFPILRHRRFEFGPAFGFEGSRRSRDVGGALPKVGFTVEAGGFAQYALTDALRVRVEARQGIGGHKGLIGVVGGDYIARDGDRWLFSLGPRVTFSDGRYNRAYFGVAPADAARSGLPAFKADGGVQALGATAGLLRQFTPRWGIYSYAKYDRLVSDPGRSPVVRAFGSRNQLSGGLALTYTFGAGVR